MTPTGIAWLRRDEGYALKLPDGRCQAYPDPRSQLAIALRQAMKDRPANWRSFSGSPWTIGYGHTGPDVFPGVVWTPEEAAVSLDHDVARAEALCDHHVPWWRKLNAARQDIIAIMMFNMGWDDIRTIKHEGLSGFVNTLAAMQRGDFKAAADGMENSGWFHQVGARAQRMADVMRSGAYPTH